MGRLGGSKVVKEPEKPKRRSDFRPDYGDKILTKGIYSHVVYVPNKTIIYFDDGRTAVIEGVLALNVKTGTPLAFIRRSASIGGREVPDNTEDLFMDGKEAIFIRLPMTWNDIFEYL